MEWHELNTLEATSWDTPELVKARNACNQEIEAIHEERSRIDSALQALASVDVASIDFDKLEADRKRIDRERLTLLQRELKLRRDQLVPLTRMNKEAASAAYDNLYRQVPEIEANIIKRLESIGYRKFITSPVAGSWNPGMVNGHPDRMKADSQLSEFRQALRHSEADTQNLDAINSIQAELSKALSKVAA